MNKRTVEQKALEARLRDALQAPGQIEAIMAVAYQAALDGDFDPISKFLPYGVRKMTETHKIEGLEGLTGPEFIKQAVEMAIAHWHDTHRP